MNKETVIQILEKRRKEFYELVGHRYPAKEMQQAIEIITNNVPPEYFEQSQLPIGEEVKLGEWQKCPICDGNGRLENIGLSTAIDRVCDVCKGAKIILKPVLQQTQSLSIEVEKGCIAGKYGMGDKACSYPNCECHFASTPSIKEEKVSTETLPEAAKSVIDNLTDTYTARNGKICHIEDENGEKMYIVPFDDIERLKAATEACQMHSNNGLDELIEWIERYRHASNPVDKIISKANEIKEQINKQP